MRDSGPPEVHVRWHHDGITPYWVASVTGSSIVTMSQRSPEGAASKAVEELIIQGLVDSTQAEGIAVHISPA
jgi:hypothetical protein